MNMHLPFTNSHLPIKYQLPFTKTSDKWLMANNSANGNWQLAIGAGGAR
ncbi:MAG: hypothetical protein Q7R60_02155 [bacterium]|nr:hypothetical protein [bacterium]